MSNSYVYILSDDTKTLIIKSKMITTESEKSQLSFYSKHLVYYEICDNIVEADKRKKTFESWPDGKIKFLIDFVNPKWEDWKKEITN